MSHPDQSWKKCFLRAVQSRGGDIHFHNLVEAGYPKVECPRHIPWSQLHQLCQEQFKDGAGRSTYVWFGSSFFFLNEDDAHVFRGLMLMSSAMPKIKD